MFKEPDILQNKLIDEQNAKNLSRAVGFRNIAVHQYQNLDCKIIYDIIKNHLDDFKAFAQSVEKIA